MAYEVKHRLEWKSTKNNNYKLDILFMDYPGAVMESYLLEGCSISYDNKGSNKFEPIVTSELIVDLMFQDTDLFTEFINIEDEKVKCILYRDGEKYWSGFFVNENTGQAFSNDRYLRISLRFVDYLSKLESVMFNNLPLDINIDRQVNLLDIICSSLSLVNDNDVYISNEIYYGSQSAKGTRASFETFYVNYENYVDQDALVVLEDIMQSFGLTLKQKNGRWDISNFIDSGKETYYIYSSSGVFKHKSVIDSTHLVNNTDLFFDDGSIEIGYEKAYNSITINADVNKSIQIIRGGDFDNPSIWTTSTKPMFWDVNWNGGVSGVEYEADRGLVYRHPFLHTSNDSITAELYEQSQDFHLTAIDMPVESLPVTLDPNNNDKWIDLTVEYGCRIGYTEPDKEVSGFDLEIYEQKKEAQIQEFVGKANIEHLFGMEYIDSTGSYHLRFRPTTLSIAGEDIRSDWQQVPHQMWGPLSGVNTSFSKVNIQTNRNTYTRGTKPAVADIFKNGYKHTQRIYLYKDRTTKLVPLLAPDGILKIKLAAPVTTSFRQTLDKNVYGEQYLLYFTTLEFNIKNFNISNEDSTDVISYTGTINKNFSTKFEDLNIQIDTFSGKRAAGTLLYKNTFDIIVGTDPQITCNNVVFNGGLSAVLLNYYFLNYSQNSQIVSGTLQHKGNVNIFDRVRWNGKNYCITSITKDLTEESSEVELKEIFS